jgi:hypothetical protein
MTYRKGGRRMEWEGEPDESNLCKLFSDNPDNAAETILFYSDLKPLLRKMRLTDETRFYSVYQHSSVPERPDSARLRATVTQRNLLKVAAAISTSEKNDAAIQYLGTSPAQAREASSPTR